MNSQELELNKPLLAQQRDVPWFHGHNIVTAYNLAEWLSETYPEWLGMKNELEQFIRRPNDGNECKTETV